MLSKECLAKYMKAFPGHSIFFMEPGDLVCISDGETDIQQPKDETDAKFLERLSRCTKTKNVFFDEWDRAEDDPNVLY